MHHNFAGKNPRKTLVRGRKASTDLHPTGKEMTKRNANFWIDSQDATLFHAAHETYDKAVNNHLKSYAGSYDEGRSEELGFYAGLAFRAAEKLYPWPGATITSELRELAKKHGLELSYATWNRGFPDDGQEGVPYTYCYFRKKPSDEALEAFGEEAGLYFENDEGQTKDGLWVWSGTAEFKTWPDLFKDIGW